MSDDDRIIDTTMLVLKNFHLYDHGYDEDDLSDIATHILAALREDNIELVKLPKPDEGRDDWLDGTVWVDLTAKTTPIATEENPGTVIYHSIESAHTLAAALLAAARNVGGQ